MSRSVQNAEPLRVFRTAIRTDPATARSVRNLSLFVAIEQILFIPIDSIVLSGGFWTFLPFRLLILVSTLCIWLRTYHTHPIESSVFMEVSVGAMVLAMVAYDGGVTSRYSAGLILTFCALPVFVPLSVPQVTVAVLPALLGFLALPIFLSPPGWWQYALSVIFPVSGAMIAVGSTWVLDGIRFNEFTRRKELEEARDHLKALDATKSRFAANVHHELRTPLTLILAPLEAMLESTFGPVSPIQLPHLESMRSNALRLLKLINNLLDLAKLESHQMRITRRRLNLGSLIDDIVTGARGLAERKQIRLESRVANDLPTLNADRDALEKVLVNLIGNALKFTDAGGMIEISAQRAPLGVEMIVSDSGVGLPANQLERIFDRFAQVDTSATRKHEGTGIGLSLVRELVELHEGHVWATSEGIGHGAQIHVELQLGTPDIEEAENAIEAPDGHSTALQKAFDALTADTARGDLEQHDYRLSELQQSVRRWEKRDERAVSATDASKGARARVLVVEDNSDMRRLLFALLSEEFEVRTAIHGRDGLEKLHEALPDVILSDVMMPDMTGLELCAAVKSDPATREIPLLLVTSKAEREMRVEGLELGADDYVTKPFHPRELLARVRSFARLKLLQDDLTCNNAALSNALEQLKAAQSQLVHQEKMASLGQLVAGIAHEINNPVHFIQGNLDFLEEALQSLLEERRVLSADQRLERNDGLGGDLASILSGIREGVARTVGIVKDLRTFSRLDRAEMIEIDLRESLDATLNLLRAKLRTIEVLRDYGTLPLVECLAGQIGQVFMNLIVNAIDAVGDGGRIRIRTGHLPDAGFAFVEIEDNGSGMAPEVASQIFNPFFTTKEIGKGTGLGLSVSHGIIERHKGSIRVSSEVGVGSTFRVELPISMSKAEASVPEPHLERG